jgi:hypothetical protein
MTCLTISGALASIRVFLLRRLLSKEIFCSLVMYHNIIEGEKYEDRGGTGEERGKGERREGRNEEGRRMYEGMRKIK